MLVLLRPPSPRLVFVRPPSSLAVRQKVLCSVIFAQPATRSHTYVHIVSLSTEAMKKNRKRPSAADIVVQPETEIPAKVHFIRICGSGM